MMSRGNYFEINLDGNAATESQDRGLFEMMIQVKQLK